MNSMGFMSAIAAIIITGIVAGTIGDVLKSRTKSRATGADLQNAIDELAGRMEKLEGRMANIESIVVEQDKHQRFDEAL